MRRLWLQYPETISSGRKWMNCGILESILLQKIETRWLFSLWFVRLPTSSMTTSRNYTKCLRPDRNILRKQSNGIQMSLFFILNHVELQEKGQRDVSLLAGGVAAAGWSFWPLNRRAIDHDQSTAIATGRAIGATRCLTDAGRSISAVGRPVVQYLPNSVVEPNQSNVITFSALFVPLWSYLFLK